MAITEDARLWIEETGRFLGPRELGYASAGKRPVVVVETQGPSVALASDVLVLTDRGEVPAGELRRGSYVAYLRRQPIVNRDAQKVRLGEIVGYIAAFGTMHHCQAVVSPPIHQPRPDEPPNDIR